MAETSHNILLLHSIVNSIYMLVLTVENAITSVAFHHSNITSPAVLVHGTVYAFPIHAFNKFGRHLEFSMNDVIRGKIIHVAKIATKDEISVDVDFAVCSCKKERFYFISRGIFSFYNVFMGMLSILGDPGVDSGGERKSKRAGKYSTKKSKERREEPLGTLSYQNSSKRSPPFCLLIGQKDTKVFWHQSEARTTATV